MLEELLFGKEKAPFHLHFFFLICSIYSERLAIA